MLTLLLFLALVSLLAYPAPSAGNPIQYGKVPLDKTLTNIRCQTVNYPQVFSGSGKVRVLASISHVTSEFSNVHDSAVVWTKYVTERKFDVCIMESGKGTNGTVLVNWVAFQSTPSGIFGGTASVGLFTSNTKCTRVDFGKSFPKIPKVLATVRRTTENEFQEPINLWLEDIHVNYFRVCLREVITFGGKHKDVQVDWMAFVSAAKVFTHNGHKMFENTKPPLEKDNFAYCQVVNFTGVFYADPVVIVTANHEYDTNSSYSFKPENNFINAWVEEITNKSFRMCIKDKAGISSQHDPIHVDYITLGDLDPCINVTCSYYAECKAFGPNDARCVCVKDCPSYEEPVCSSNGTTYDNECLYKLDMCQNKASLTISHPGSCRGFSAQKGRSEVHRSKIWSTTACEEVTINPYNFYPDKPIHVQVSVNHFNYTNASFVHEASVPWVENIRETKFTACVTKAGRNEKATDYFATVDWLAYQGAPAGGVAGEIDMPTWWTGSSCQIVKFPAGKFSSAPVVLVTAEHERLGIKHDASTTWVEDVTTSSFKVCIRELQNFDGAHERIKIDWIAFADLPQPLFREHGTMLFKNGHEPLKEFNYAFCKDINFVKPYDMAPSVLITANHSTSGGNLNPEYNSISAWVEYINTTGFRACTKELFVKKHDPLSISYAVMPDVCEPGWSFFNGSCYLTSNKCESWTNATKKCQSMKANLVSIRSQEENIFVQHRRNSAKSWIGLNDIASEGAYRWVDGSSSQFRFWAKGQPNNLDGNQDCVHALGIQNGYKWNDVDCSACHNFTCEKDYDECASAPCLNGGTCVSKSESFSCICPRSNVGRQCEEYASTCKELYNKGRAEDKAYSLKMDIGKVSTFCQMTGIAGCGRGGWTLVMKIDGSKSTFGYESSSWGNKQSYNMAGGTTGLDYKETKLPSYWNTPFTKICLGMKVGADTRFLLLQKQASSLYSLIADGSLRTTSLGRNAWKHLIAGSSLQRNCEREGFNVKPTRKDLARVRIGIIGNQENDCHTPDSFIGFGSSMTAGGRTKYTCGNTATNHDPDNGSKNIRANCYIFVQ